MQTTTAAMGGEVFATIWAGHVRRLCAHRALAVLMLVMLGACGGGGGGGDSGGTVIAGNYFPLHVGDHWIYRTESGALEKLRLTGATASPFGSAAIVLTGPPGATALAEQRFIDTGSALLQLPGPQADPLTLAAGPVMLLRYPLTVGDSFVQSDFGVDSGVDADGDGRTDRLALHSEVTVLGVESVNTAAGAFADSAHVRTVLTLTLTASSNGAQVAATTTVDDWYARDVGPVRSQAVTRLGAITETISRELVAFHVAGRRSESVAPGVAALDPPPGGVSRLINGIAIDFSETIDADTATAANLTLLDPSGQAVAAGMTIADTRITLFPPLGLASGSYTLRLGGGLADLAGNPLPEQQWVFGIDSSAPMVVSVSPAADARDVPLSPTIRITFSEDIDPASAVGSISIVDGASQVPFATTVNGNEIVLTPTVALRRQARHTVAVQWWIADRRGNTMGNTYSWEFTTDPGMLSDPINRLTGSSPASVAIGDVNGDGRPDVVMTTWYAFDAVNDFKLFVFLQQSNGTLAEPIKYDTSSSYGCRADSIAIADMNGDGRNDVVLGESGCGIEFFMQDGVGQLTSALFITTPESHKLRAVDLDGDGRADLVGAGWGTSQVAVWRQQAGGALSGPSLYAVDHYGWGDLEVGDINGDGRPDIVVTSGQGDHNRALGMITQQADGSFGAPSYRAVDPVWGSWGVAIGDINGDGRNDVVVGFGGNSPTSIGVFYQQPDGTLAPMLAVPAYDIPGGIEIADLDNDGRKDVIVQHRGWNAVSVYLQQPDGTLAPRELFLANYGDNNPQAIAVADVNGDGYADVAIAGLTLLLNRTPQLSAVASAGVPASRLAGWSRWRPGPWGSSGSGTGSTATR